MENALREQRCQPCEGDVPPLPADDLARHRAGLSARWTLDAEQRCLSADFSFRNYYQVQAFINAVAWIAHGENHHPDIHFGYRNATVSWTTHAAGGLTLNDFICAAKVDALHDEAPDA